MESFHSAALHLASSTLTSASQRTGSWNHQLPVQDASWLSCLDGAGSTQCPIVTWAAGWAIRVQAQTARP